MPDLPITGLTTLSSAGATDLLPIVDLAAGRTKKITKNNFLGTNLIAWSGLAIGGVVSDTAYNATSWNGVTTIAPSKNAVRDEFENKVSKLTGNVSFVNYSANELSITNDNDLYTKGYLYMGPTELNLGFGSGTYLDMDATSVVFKTNTGDVQVPSGSGTLALTSQITGTNSGTNTGDQTITLTGDVTGSGTGSFATSIGASKVTNSMLFGGIGYSKLSLTGAILNADLAGSIAASKLVGSDIATVGTITSGTWNGSLLTGTYGGTGVNNGASTFTYGANTTITGGGTLALGGFTLTAPATGTAALLGTANVFTANQAITVSSTGNSTFMNTNSNGGTAAQAFTGVGNGTTNFYSQILGTGFTTSGLLVANLGIQNNTGTVGTLYLNSNASTSTYHRWAIGGTAAGNQIMNLLTTGLSLTPTTLTDGTNALKLTATMPTTITAANNAVDFQVTGAGSSSFTQRAFNINLLAGYTGSSQTSAAGFGNASVGTGANLLATTALGNYGVNATSSGSTTGYNVGGRYVASAGNLSLGIAGVAIVAKGSATNGGGAFFGNNGGASSIHFGVYAGLNTTDPTFASAALIADNSSMTDPIALFRDNGTAVVTIGDGGKITLASTNTAGGTTGDQTINKASGTVNIAASGTTVTVTNSLCTTSSIVIPVIRTNDSTAKIKNVVPGAGSFVITLDAAATSEISIGFMVIN